MFPFFRKIRQNLIAGNRIGKYLLYALGEILLVVIGILIALRVNNWNEQRIRDARFNFGLSSLYGEIQSTAYVQNGIIDKIGFQLLMIDSLLYAADGLEAHKVPAILVILDESGFVPTDNEWKSQYLEVDTSKPERSRFITALRSLVNSSAGIDRFLASHHLTDAMKTYLRTFNVPYEIYSQDIGVTYKDFIESRAEGYYSQRQLENIHNLLSDESFRADLQTMKGIKTAIREYALVAGHGADDFLQNIQSFNPETDYSLKQLEIIGSGLPDGQWARGIRMKRVSADDDSRWEIRQQLVDGEIKFRGDVDWTLDWGRGQTGENHLVFKGGNIPVSAGNYMIRVDLRKATYEFIPRGQ